MSRLGDLENALVSRVAAAMSGGSAVFAVVKGASGGYRPAIREALKRERMPAAYVAFVEESAAPETKTSVRGARFSVLVAATSLRVGSQPRQDTTGARGAFTLLDEVRKQLNDYVPAAGLRAVIVQEKFLEADERTAIYEVLYRLWPVIEAPLTFNGLMIAGSGSRMALEVGPLAVAHAGLAVADSDGKYSLLMMLKTRTLIWRGQLRAASNGSLNVIESNISDVLMSQTHAAIEDGTGRTFQGCVLDQFVRDGPRRSEDNGAVIVQDAELHFLQYNPTQATLAQEGN
jgi:hypothetical protein